MEPGEEEEDMWAPPPPPPPLEYGDWPYMLAELSPAAFP
jgi:hypothetical protein